MNILVFGNHYFKLNQSIASAFQQYGLHPRIMGYQDVRYQKTFSRNPYKRGKRLSQLQQINSDLKREVEREKPDVFFALAGNVLYPETLRWLRERGIILVIHLLDSINMLPLTQQGLEAYHFIYVFEPTDIPFIAKKNPNVFYLAPAYDPDYYYPLPSPEKKYDVTFVGTPFAERLPTLNGLAEIALKKGLRVGLVGKYWHRGWRELKFKIRFPFIARFIIKNGTMEPEEVNKLYNQSKIVLNHHCDQSQEGVNCRLFDIAGSHAFQLVDEKAVLSRMFRINEEVVTYKSVEDLKAKVSYYLTKPLIREKLSQAAGKRARKEHTYFHRIGKILEDLQRAAA